MSSAIKSEEYAELGRSLANLSPITQLETRVDEIPPVGAGKLLEAHDTKFVWEPMSEQEWNSLGDTERGRIVADRAVAWLERNASLMTAPFSFVDETDEQVNRAFGINVHNVHEALCATYRMLVDHEEAVDWALVGLAGIATVSVGAHAIVLGLHATATIVKSYGHRCCQ